MFAIGKQLREKIISNIKAESGVVLQRRPNTCVVIYHICNGRIYKGVGFSKQMRIDEWDDSTGVLKAYGRAVSDIFSQIKATMEIQEAIELRKREAELLTFPMPII